MGSGLGLDGESSTKFVQHPGLGSRQTLEMLLGTTWHVVDLLLLKTISHITAFKECKFKLKGAIMITCHTFPLNLWLEL